MVFANNTLVNFSIKSKVVTASASFYQPWFGPKSNDTTALMADIKWADLFKGLGSKIDARLTTGSVIATNADFTHKKFKEKAASISEITTIVTEAKIYPNPMNGNGVISFDLPTTSELTINLFDITGKMISTLAKGSFESGVNNVAINASTLENGIYLVAISNGVSSETIRLAIEK